MPRPFRFGVTEAHAPSRTAWATIARRVEELGYATLLIPDRMNVGSLAPTPAPGYAIVATALCASNVSGMGKPPRSRVGEVACCILFRWVPRRSSGGIGAGESIGAPVYNSCDTNASR